VLQNWYNKGHGYVLVGKSEGNKNCEDQLGMLDNNKLNFKGILHGNVKCLCVIQGVYGWLVLVNTVPLCSWRVFRGFTIRISAETLSVLTDGFRDFLQGEVTVDYCRPLSKAFQFVIRCHFSFPSILSEFFKTSSSHFMK
jgi:hypothetical protein